MFSRMAFASVSITVKWEQMVAPASGFSRRFQESELVRARSMVIVLFLLAMTGGGGHDRCIRVTWAVSTKPTCSTGPDPLSQNRDFIHISGSFCYSHKIKKPRAGGGHDRKQGHQ